MAPGCRPLGQRRAGPEFDVVGVGTDGQGTDGVGRSTVTVTVRADRRSGGPTPVGPVAIGMLRCRSRSSVRVRRRDHVRRHVDVPGQVGEVEHPHGQPQPLCFGPVAGERARSVGEAEAGVGGEGDDVGAVAVPIGDEGDPGRVPTAARPLAIGRSAWDTVTWTPLQSAGGRPRPRPRRSGPDPAPRPPAHHVLAGPVGDLVVITHHGDRQRPAAASTWSAIDGRAPAVRPVRARSSRRFASWKALTGTSTARGPRPRSGLGWCAPGSATRPV